MMTQKEFDQYMVENDSINNAKEYLSGIINSHIDGEDPQQLEFSPEEADMAWDAQHLQHKQLSIKLRVKVAVLEDLLCSAIVNRWVVYNEVVRGRR